MPVTADRNIKIPTTITDAAIDGDDADADAGVVAQDLFRHDLTVGRRRQSTDLHIIYDSQNQVSVSKKLFFRRQCRTAK
jgi:hypothetical protein